MNPKKAEHRRIGSPIPHRLYKIIPTKPGALEWLRIQILFRFLLQSEFTTNEALEPFTRAALEWMKTYPLTNPICRKMASEWIMRFFLIDNPSLVPLLLPDYYHQAIVWERGKDAATFRIEALAKDPTLLGRPTDREGRRYYSKIQDQRRIKASSPDSQRVDILALARVAEAWVVVRHKIVPSLSGFVTGQSFRPYSKKDPEEPEFSDRYRNWQIALQEFDEALQYTNWSTVFH